MKRAALIGAAALLAAAIAFPYLDRFPSVCLYRMATGHLCVFCGMTHALGLAARGRWGDAQAANPLWLPLFAAFVFVAARPQRRLIWPVVILCTVATALRW